MALLLVLLLETSACLVESLLRVWQHLALDGVLGTRSRVGKAKHLPQPLMHKQLEPGRKAPSPNLN